MNTMTKFPPPRTPVTQAVPAPDVFSALQRQVGRLFEDFTPSFAPAFWSERDVADFQAPMDVARTKDGFELTLELPGVEEKDVDVGYADGVLTIGGHKAVEAERKDKTFQFVERRYGAFTRSIRLPEGVSADKIKASMSKGVLKVFVPTVAAPEAKKIAVTAA